MDGGSGLNIMYAKTLDVMGVNRTHLHPIRAPFHGVVPGKQAMPLGQIDLPVTFGDQFNYRTETLTFERAYEYEVECCGHATAIVAFGELAALKKEVSEEAPDAKKSAGSFKATEGSKEVLIDPSSSEGKTKLLYTVFITKRKLRHYFESHPVMVVTSFPLSEVI
ncbi:uncharacterized protein [Miscanthus floridulus]|uniref:uncharacterized protein n=1 Tax=Miscanthus floridulus TaxID=154761 RepID=UPI0034575B49